MKEKYLKVSIMVKKFLIETIYMMFFSRNQDLIKQLDNKYLNSIKTWPM